MVDSPLKVKVFTTSTFEGVSGVAILQEILDKDVNIEVEYTRHIDFRNHTQFEGVDVNLVLGLPYRGYNLPQDFYIKNNVPFEDFIHIGTYGDTIQGEHIISIVEEEQDPIKTLYDMLVQARQGTILSKFVQISGKAESMVQAVNAYRIWDWQSNSTTRMLLSLYHASYKMLPRILYGTSLTDVVRQYAPIIKGQMELMSDSIQRKVDTSKTYEVVIDGEISILRVAFTDEYVNEVANELLNIDTHNPIIACVGRTTKGNDMFSIRTSKIDASKVAYLINEGAGKETVASVFSEIGYTELMGNSIYTALKNE